MIYRCMNSLICWSICWLLPCHRSSRKAWAPRHLSILQARLASVILYSIICHSISLNYSSAKKGGFYWLFFLSYILAWFLSWCHKSCAFLASAQRATGILKWLKRNKIEVGWIGKLVVIRVLLHGWVLKPVLLAPGVNVVVVVLLVDVAVLLPGEDWLGEKG